MGNKFSQDDTQHHGTQKSQNDDDELMRDLDDKQREDLLRTEREADGEPESDKDMAAM